MPDSSWTESTVHDLPVSWYELTEGESARENVMLSYPNYG